MFRVNASELNTTNLDIIYERMTCEDLLGPNLVKILHALILLLRLAGAIICIVSGMLTLVPAVVQDDASALKKASKKLISTPKLKQKQLKKITQIKLEDSNSFG